MNIIRYKILLNVYMHWLVLSQYRISSMHDQGLFKIGKQHWEEGGGGIKSTVGITYLLHGAESFLRS